MSKHPDYEIGYGKPPKASRFKPGTSGNPKGKPKGQPKSLLDDIIAELQECVAVTEGGKVKKVTKQRLVIKSLMKKAAEANPHALRFLNGATSGFDPKHFGVSKGEFRMTSAAMELIEQVKDDILAMGMETKPKEPGEKAE